MSDTTGIAGSPPPPPPPPAPPGGGGVQELEETEECSVMEIESVSVTCIESSSTTTTEQSDTNGVALKGGDDGADADAADECQKENIMDISMKLEEESESTEQNGSGSLTADDETRSPNTNATVSEAESDSSSESKTSGDGTPPAKKKRKVGEHVGGIKAIQHHQVLKKTLAPFIQLKSCEKLKHALGKCLDCKTSRNSRIVGKKKDLCRFVSFRKLRYTERGSMTVAGFSDVTSKDYTESDLSLWMPRDPPTELSLELATFLVTELGDQFCELVKLEKQALLLHEEQENQLIVWRRVIQGLRELCDVCSTTLFNYHWTCGKCGFVVCVSCFNSRKQNVQVSSDSNLAVSENKDEFRWLKCHLKTPHKIEQLMLTQIIAGKSLDILWTKLHNVRKNLKLPQVCGCDCEEMQQDIIPSDLSTKLIPSQIENEKVPKTNDSSEEVETLPDNLEAKEVSEINQSSDSLNNGTPSESSSKAETDVNPDDDSDEDDEGGIMDLFGSSEGNIESKTDGEVTNTEATQGENHSTEPTETTEKKEPDEAPSCEPIPDNENKEVVLNNFIRSGVSSRYCITVVPKRVTSWSESNRLYPHVPHAWLCEGFLLRLLDPINSGNFQMFQEQWKRGQPVLVSNVASKLDQNLWTPESFSRDFGHKTNHLINCMTGKVVPSRKMKKFWDGFEYMKQRLQDDNGEPMLLKLKDWPPGEDFAEMLPSRFKDLMSVLPLGEYTHRDGKLNLAARLPDIFSRPDLGPKMYIAYGSGLHLDKGTTNLHLDVSDAVNVMVYVGVVKDEDLTLHNEAVMKAIEESDCDIPTINRVRKNKELPGALWHIWEARDADKIRDLLNKVALEKGTKVERCHDAIHDQSWYLDRSLRHKLMKEYNVRGYPILQCAGDAVFIPAGAPHQVRNLNNCIKVAEDFVSPENVRHCFHLTEEFRNLTETHTNHEDKLQIKNIVYHTVKDAISVIESSFSS